METFDLPGSLPNDRVKVSEKTGERYGLIREVVNFFEQRAAAKKEKEEEKAFRDRVISFTKQEDQEPKARFIAGGPSTLDLSQTSPGSIFRIEALKKIDDELRGEEDSEVLFEDEKYYFWFVKAGRDEVYKIHGVVYGRETNNPSSSPRLGVESRDVKYKLVKTKINQRNFKPEDALKIVYASEKNMPDAYLYPESVSDPEKYLHEIYQVSMVDNMGFGDFKQEVGGGGKSDVVKEVAIASNRQVLQPTAA